MLFNSEQFMIFLPIALLGYYLIPRVAKHIWLLMASYFFYMCWNAEYAVLILASTVITYGCGLLIYKFEKQSIKKSIVAFGLISNLGILFFFKYINFVLGTLQSLLEIIHIKLNVPAFDMLLPVGISFYTFQALSYTIDVYRGETEPQKNFFRYALFVSFFPQLVAGPIERSQNLMVQLAEPKKFSFDNFKEGLMLMIWGYFLKIVLADRAAIFVDIVYGNYRVYYGWYIVVATLLFAVQIYSDFYGYSAIAMGTAKMLGITLMENFDAPYMSKSISEFWRRWHISLTTWFKDYLYIPLGGGGKGKIRKYINKMIVFLVSGMWHGARFSYIAWGGINGVYQVIGDLLKPIKDKMVGLLHLNRNTFSHKLAQTVVTFLLIDFSWIFFRAAGFMVALSVIKAMVSENNLWILFDGSLYNCGLDRKNFTVMLIAMLVLTVADIAKYNRISVRKIILKQEYWFRWIFIAFSIWMIMILGIWGPSYDVANFIYFQF